MENKNDEKEQVHFRTVKDENGVVVDTQTIDKESLEKMGKKNLEVEVAETVSNTDDTISDTKIIKHNMEKDKTDFQKELEKQVEEEEIDFNTITFDDEEKHYPAVTDEDLSTFCELTSISMDKDIIYTLVNTSRDQIAMYIDESSTGFENYKYLIEEENNTSEYDESVKNITEMYEDSKKMLAFIQKKVKEIKELFEAEHLLELQVRNTTLVDFFKYVFRNKLTGDEETNSKKVDEFVEEMKTNGILTSTIQSELYRQSVNSSTSNYNMFSKSFLEKYYGNKINFIKTLTGNSKSIKENFDLQKVLEIVEKDSSIYTQILLTLDTIADDEYSLLTKDNEKYEEIKSKLFETYDRDEFYRKNFEPEDSNIKNILKERNIIIDNLLSKDKSRNFIDNIIYSLELLLKEDKFISNYEKTNNIDIISISNEEEWLKFSEDFSKKAVERSTTLNDWCIVHISIDKINMYKSLHSWLEYINSDNRTESEDIKRTRVLLDLFIEKYIGYVMFSLVYRFKEYQIEELKTSKKIIPYCLDFMMSMINLNKFIINTCDINNEKTIEEILSDKDSLKRFRLEKDDILFDYLDPRLMKSGVLYNLTSFITYMRHSYNWFNRYSIEDIGKTEVLIDSATKEEKFFIRNGLLKVKRVKNPKKTSRRNRR